MKRILIVDDERMIGHTLSALLRRNDTYIKTVECGKDALSEISHVSYDLCFLDIYLPDLSGMDLMKTIRKSSPATLIIMMTGALITEPEQLKSISTHAHLIISKPFDLDRLKMFVDRIMGQETSPDEPEDRSNSRNGHAPFENRLDEKRKFARQAVMLNATCSVVASDDERGETSFTARILEMSDTGMCIRTGYLLKPGQFLRFSDDPMQSTGIVKWSKDGETENSYRTGIQFIMPEGSGLSKMFVLARKNIELSKES